MPVSDLAGDPFILNAICLRLIVFRGTWKIRIEILIFWKILIRKFNAANADDPYFNWHAFCCLFRVQRTQLIL